VVIATGNHYVLDVAAGAAVAEAAWWTARGASLSFGALRRLSAADRRTALTPGMAERQAAD
jgi:hypothetical protein